MIGTKKTSSRGFKNWQEHYRSRLISADAAAGLVKCGQRVSIGNDWQPVLLTQALLARGGELREVELSAFAQMDPAWLRPPASDAFRFIFGMPPMSDVSHVAHDFLPSTSFVTSKLAQERPLDRRTLDVYMLVVGPPDANGFCSLGRSNAGKTPDVRRASTVIAEVVDHYQTRVRLIGQGAIHVSQVDYFVENPCPDESLAGAMVRQRLVEGDQRARTIAGYLADLIQDGDVIEVGMGRNSEGLFRLAMLDEKRDLAIHSGQAVPGVIDHVRRGIITGARRTFRRSTAVLVSAITDASEEGLAFVDNNPAFELQPMELLNDPRVVAQNDNFVAVNGVLAVDLAGQMTSESIGMRVLGIAGGLPGFALGALMSRGGRSICVCPATSAGRGEEVASRILPRFPEGTRVTLPSYLADIVVSEFGVARLMGKTANERARELISIAHPDFRAHLERASSG